MLKKIGTNFPICCIFVNNMLAYLVWILTGGGKMRWDKKDIPHKGWTEIGMEDLGEEAEFGEDIEYERCEMCGNEKIRYVHIMTHPEFPGELRVGCICACHMTDDYENPGSKGKRFEKSSTTKKEFYEKRMASGS